MFQSRFTEMGGVRVLEVAGALTLAETDELREPFQEMFAPRCRVVVDLSNVTSVTTPAVTLLMWGHRRTGEVEGNMALVAPPGPVRDVLHRCRLDRVLQLADDLRSAMELLKRPGG